MELEYITERKTPKKSKNKTIKRKSSVVNLYNKNKSVGNLLGIK